MSQRTPDEDAPDWEPPPDSVEIDSELPADSPAAPDPEPDPETPGVAGPLGDDAQALLAAASAVLGTQAAHFRALKRLFLEEFALARDSIVYALVFLLLSMVLFATAYALLAVLVVFGLRWVGLPWMLALAIPLLVSAGLGWIGFTRSRALFRYADFESTRRQLARGLTVPKEAESEE